MTNRNLYDLLEVSPDATQEEIKESYRLIASMLHPDKFLQNSMQWVRANEKTKEVNEAYYILADAEQRLRYDQELFGQNAERPAHILTEAQQHLRYERGLFEPPAGQKNDNILLRYMCGSFGAGCFAAALINFMSSYANSMSGYANAMSGHANAFTGGIDVSNITVMTVIGTGFLLYAFLAKEKPR